MKFMKKCFELMVTIYADQKFKIITKGFQRADGTREFMKFREHVNEFMGRIR